MNEHRAVGRRGLRPKEAREEVKSSRMKANDKLALVQGMDGSRIDLGMGPITLIQTLVPSVEAYLGQTWEGQLSPAGILEKVSPIM